MLVIFLVIASQDPIHEADLATQKKTWASNLPPNYRVIWLRGSHGDDYVLDGDTLYVPCLELYSNILQKTILGVRFILEKFDVDVLVRTNVSTYFDLPRLQHEMRKKLYRKPFVGGYVDKTKGGYFGKSLTCDYISGTGIFFSKETAHLLSKMNSSDYLQIPDDVAITEYLLKHNVPLVRMHRNNLGSTHLFFPSYFTRAKSSTDSTLASKRMLLLYRFFSTDRFIRRARVTLDIFRQEFKAFLNHPEGLLKYFQRNRVVFQGYMYTKGWRFWSRITQP